MEVSGGGAGSTGFVFLLSFSFADCIFFATFFFSFANAIWHREERSTAVVVVRL